MSENEQLRYILFKAWETECRGNNLENAQILSEKDKIGVLVRVYKDGHTEPICKYLSGNFKDKCNVSRLEEAEKGFCPYREF